jgi:ABC-type sugar transport system ATPase subunit
MAVAARGISKSFPGTCALDRVDLSVGAGEVHALLGANGSGKSTLVKILSGVYRPDAGELRVGEHDLALLGSPGEAHALGIAVVHQESPLVDTLTVAECVALFRGYPTRRGRILWRAVRRDTRDLLERFGVSVDPGTLAGLLTPAQRALVALAIALDGVSAGQREVSLLILDEVTASLPEDQAASYLEQVGMLARSGTPVLMVTHRLSELHELATHVTVLRDGRRVHHATAGAVDDDTLIRHIVGADRENVDPAREHVDGVAAVEQLWTGRHRVRDDSVLEAEHLAADLIRDVSFTLRAGEIVGVGGLADSGIAELPLVLSGGRPRTGGALRIAGREIPAQTSPRATIDAGLALLPADRLRSGGIASLAVAENVVLPDARSYWHRRGAERATLRRLIERLDVRPPSSSALFGSLSGGNQQKVLLGKWLLLGPSVMVLDDPTSGVDPGARETIFSILREAASGGLAILLFSTELEQLVAMCSRVLVLRNGTIETELAGGELTREAVTKWCCT